MKRIGFGCMLFFCVGGVARAEDPVHFADAKLKAAVEDALSIPDPTPTDMLGLTELERVGEFAEQQEGISDISGLEYAVNLRLLNLRLNWIDDIRALSGLTSLESLNLSQNQIGDLLPLAGLRALRYLNLHENPTRNFWAISHLVNLETFIAHLNGIEDISFLSGLTHLREVDLARNHISDLSPLGALTNLVYLDVQGNPLTRESCDVVLARIAANNPQAVIRCDSHAGLLLTVSSTAGGSVIDPGEGEFSYADAVSVRLEARARPGFVFAGWYGTYSTDRNPVYLTMRQDERMTAQFVSLQDTLHVDDDAPGDPAPGDPAVSDPNEDGTPAHPFDRIQEAIDVAGAGVTILVQPGIYGENLDARRKDIQLVGAGPNDLVETTWPTIRAATPGPVIYFSGGDGLPRLLTGFVVSGGRNDVGGAIRCEHTAVEIANCLIVGNYSSDPNGGAVCGTDSRITLTNCTIADNRGGPRSAAMVLVDSDLTVTNSILWNSTSDQVLAIGAGRPDIHYSVVRGWWADVGDIQSDPRFARQGYWSNPRDANEILDPGDARAIWRAGDYHLLSRVGRWDPQAQTWVQDDVTSPCIDSGARTSPVGDEPQPNGGTINMGAYGGTSQASLSYLSPTFQP
jgi:hypothetical protein